MLQEAEVSGLFTQVDRGDKAGASEDCSFYIKRVQELGREAAYFLFGPSLVSINHMNTFDFNGQAIFNEAKFLCRMVLNY